MIALIAGMLALAPCPPGTERQPAQHPLAPGVCIKREVICDDRCRERRRVARWHARQRRVVAPYKQKLRRMAWCESNGRWHIATGNGFYGGLQFDQRTWRSVGGQGLPHWHSRLEQSYRAVLLIRRRGYQPWPVCGTA